MTYIWEFKSTDLGYAIECSKCKHKIGAKDALIADKVIEKCPFCKTTMDMTNFDYDKLYSMAQETPDAMY